MEHPLVIMAIVLGTVLALLCTGIWVGGAVALVGIILLTFFVGGGKISMVGPLQFNMLNAFTYTCIPLFIFMGELVMHSRMGEKLYRGANNWVGFLPGGLLHTNIASCAFFAAISGTSMATAATIGMVAIPEMEKRGYDRKLVLGSLAAGGTLGILIPPSAAMIVYGAFVGESIGQLFIAGILPGLTMAGFFMAYIGIMSAIRPQIVPPRGAISLKAMLLSIWDILPLVVLIFLVLGTIYLGLATPTEAAALGVMGAMMFSAIYRRLNWRVLKAATLSTVKVTCWMMFIVIGAYVLSMGLSFLRVPSNLVIWITSFEISRGYVFIVICLLYIVLGCFIDGLSMILLTLPVVYPVMMALGFDSVWFGIILVIVQEMGQITPPVGLNLFVIHGISGGKHFKDIVIGSFPFFVIMNAMVVILYFFPDLALWLPSKMFSSF